ncbi:uncharacterized protein LOC143281595 [Babylonia areolata]|uniref:uncharacterized protein LOC143281595 n=1 Tax=Babylonia areolata TaxID=304850 RepID=UPI003FCF4B19
MMWMTAMDNTTMTGWSGKRCAAVIVLLVGSLLPLRVTGTYHITLAVAEAGETNEAAIVETTQMSLGNDTFDVTVLWTLANRRDPFQMTQHLETLVRRQVDLLFVHDELSALMRDVSKLMPGTPQTVTYFQTDKPDSTEGGKPPCHLHDNSQSSGLQESGSKQCNGLEAEVTMAESVVAVIRKLQWKKLVVIVDKAHEMVGKELSDSLAGLACQTQFLSFGVIEHAPQDGVSSGSGEGQSLHGVIQSLYNRHVGDLRVVLLCSVHCASQMLTAASEFDQLNHKRTAMAMISRWLLVLPPRDQQFLESCDLQLDNIAVLVHPPEGLLSAVNDIRKDLPSIVETAYSQLAAMNDSMSAENLTQAIIESFKASQNCYRAYLRTLLWKPEGRRLSDVGHVGQDRQLHMAQDQEVFPNVKFGLNNRKFVVATLPWPSFIERTGNGSYVGLCVDLLRQLQVSLNFSFEWVEPEDQQWGVLTPNNTWTGLVGMLERKEVDMVMAPVSVQADREAAMDFTYPFYIDYTTVLLKLPDPADSKWKRLIQPFQPKVHMFIWISLLSVTVVTFLLELVNPFYRTNTKAMLHLGDMFWYMFGALLTQGGARLPDSQTGRTMVSAFWLFSIVMAAIYGGNLIAFLTVSIDSPPFDTLREMVEQDEYIWGTLGGTFFLTLFEKSPIDVFKKIWRGLDRARGSDPDVVSGDPERHLAKVKAGHYAYIGDKSAISTWLKTECDLITIEEEFLPMQYAVGLINNSDYTRLFSDEILEINELGLTETWIRKWWSKTSFCQGALLPSATPIQLIDVQSAFYLVFIGITTSFLLLLFEKLSHRFHLFTRLKRFFSTKGAAGCGWGGDQPTVVWNSSYVSYDGTTVTHQIRTQDLVPDRPLGREFNHRSLFYLDTSPHPARAASNGRAVSDGGRCSPYEDEPPRGDYHSDLEAELGEHVGTGDPATERGYDDTRGNGSVNGHPCRSSSVADYSGPRTRRQHRCNGTLKNTFSG